MRRQYITKLLAGILAAALFTGCGLSNTAGDTVSDGAVSGSAVSRSAAFFDKRGVKDQADKDMASDHKVKNCLANDDNEYIFSYGEGLVQTRLDGSHKKKITINKMEELCWVTNEWVYYIGETKDGDALYRIPISKTEQGDSLLPQKSETVTSSYIISAEIYVTDTYIIYCGTEEAGGTDTVYKLDLQKGEKKKLYEPENEDSQLDLSFSGGTKRYPLMSCGKLFLDDAEEGNVWSLDPETEEWKLLISEKDGILCDMIQDKIWILSEASIYRYDDKREEAVCVLAQEEIREVLVQEELWKKKFDIASVYIPEIFYYDGRFYLRIYAGGVGDGVDALLSFSLQNPEDIRNEKAASDFLMYDDYRVEDCWCGAGGVRDGKILLEVWGEEIDIYAVYELDTREVRKISEKEADRLFPAE